MIAALQVLLQPMSIAADKVHTVQVIDAPIQCELWAGSPPSDAVQYCKYMQNFPAEDCI